MAVWRADSIDCVRCHVSETVLNATLSAAQMGKLKVYKSGNVKLHLGDVAFDMARGIACEVCSWCCH
jgi:RNA polymerase III RPC4